MIKKSVLSITLIGFVIVAILSSGCLSSSDYGPVVKVNVTEKYSEQVGVGYNRMVCTSLGTYTVRGPSTGYGSTSATEDSTMWNTIPLNQEIKVRLYGNNLWWVDWNNQCGDCGCKCATQSPTPTKCYTSSCNCGCSP